MKKVRILLFNSRVEQTIFDRLIRFWQWLFSRNSYYMYTHAEVMIDSIAYGSKPSQGGVRNRHFKKDEEYLWHYIDIYINDGQYIKLIDYLNSKYGVSYGWLAIILSQFFKLNFDKMENVFCVEYVIEALQVSNIAHFKKDPNQYDIDSMVEELVDKYKFTIVDRYNNIIKYDKKGFMSYFIK